MFIDVLLVTLSYTAFRHIVFLTHWGSVTLWAESVRWSIRWRGELASLPQSSTDAPGVLVNTNLTDSSRRNGTWIEIFQSWHLCSTGGNLLGCVHNVILDLYISVSNWNLIKIIQYPHCVSQLIRSDLWCSFVFWNIWIGFYGMRLCWYAYAKKTTTTASQKYRCCLTAWQYVRWTAMLYLATAQM